MRRVAITGGLSSGKSTVCKFLAELGAYVVSADEITHNILSSNPVVLQKIVSLLGPDVLTQGQLNRKSIAQKVFSHTESLKSLESILHPFVFYELELGYNAIKDDPRYCLFAAEIPLLYETKRESLFDYVIAVIASADKCEERFIGGKNGTKEDFLCRMHRQIDPEIKKQKAHFVVYNNGSKEELRHAVIELANQLCPNHM